jgi:hypothetical protein
MGMFRCEGIFELSALHTECVTSDCGSDWNRLATPRTARLPIESSVHLLRLETSLMARPLNQPFHVAVLLV